MNNIEVPNYLVSTKLIKMKQCYHQFADQSMIAGRIWDTNYTKINMFPELKAKGEVIPKSHYL